MGDNGTYVSFRFIPCEFRKIPVENHMHSSNIVARINLPNMSWDRRNREKGIEIFAKAQDGFFELEKDMEKKRKYIEFIEYYANLTEEEF